MDLTTAARVKDYGGISTSDFDTLLGVIITAYSARFEQYLKRFAESSARTEYFNVCSGDRLVYLEGYPVSSVTSVSNDPGWDFNTNMNTDSYSSLGSRGILAFNHDLDPGLNALKVVYTGGMAANVTAFIAAFPDIAFAMDVQCFHHFQRKEDLGASSSSVEGSTVSTPPLELLEIVKDLLNPHARVAEK